MDLGQLAAAVLRPGIDAARGAVQRVSLSLRVLMPMVEAQARAGQLPEQLVRSISAAAAVADHAALVLPPGNGPARLELGTRQLLIPASLRDALLAGLTKDAAQAQGQAPAQASNAAAAGNSLAPGNTSASAGASAATPAPPTALLTAAAAARAWLVQAQGAALSTSGAAPGFAFGPAFGPDGTARASARDAATTRRAPAQTFSEALFEPDSSQSDALNAAPVAQRLATTLARSGLFFESHLAQWQRGERSLDDVSSEFRQVASHSTLTEARQAGRTAAQIDALQTGAATLQGPAWPGQTVLIEMGRAPPADAPDQAGRDRDEEPASSSGGAAQSATYYATLRFELPQLGTLVAKLRLTDDTVAVHFESARSDVLHAALPDFAAALQARGLQSSSLSAAAPLSEGEP